MKNIENRQVGCTICGNAVRGRESSQETRGGILHEIRWTCGKCGNLIRLDEELEETPDAE